MKPSPEGSSSTSRTATTLVRTSHYEAAGSDYATNNAWRVRAGGFGMLLLVLFVGVIPAYLEVKHMPPSQRGEEAAGVHLTTWSVWPLQIRALGVHHPSADLQDAYTQMAEFANRTARPTADLETTIQHVRSHRATRNDLLIAARAAEAAASDERDALMGLVVPPSLRDNPAFNQAWKQAQLNSLAKIAAFQKLEDATTAADPLASPECQAFEAGLHKVQVGTTQALQDIRASGS